MTERGGGSGVGGGGGDSPRLQFANLDPVFVIASSLFSHENIIGINSTGERKKEDPCCLDNTQKTCTFYL